MVSEVFDIRPSNWGLRGDPYLWDDMKKEFEYNIENITIVQFEERLLKLFEDKTSKSIEIDDTVYFEEYAHGGMSSGHVNISTWRERLIPLLIDNFAKVKAGIKDD